MSIPGEALLSQKVNLLRQGTDYRLLLSTVATLCAQGGTQMSPEGALASVANAILRPIARDLSALIPKCKVMVHIYTSGE